jgi:hypothetical protein
MLQAVQPATLPPPGQPLDRGLSSLGLVMQAGALTFGVVIATSLGIWGFFTAGQPAVMPIAVVLGVARVVVHALAGWRLARGAADAPAWTRVFAVIGVVHAVALTAWLSDHDAATGRLAGAAAAGWPLAVAVITHLRRAHVTTTELRGESAAASVIARVAGLVLLAPLASVLVAWAVGRHASGAGLATILVFVGLPAGVGIVAMRGSLRGLAWSGQVIAVLVGLGTFFLVIAGVHWTLAYAPFLVGTCVLAPIVLRGHAERQPAPPDASIAHGSARLTIAWILLAQGLVTVVHPLMSAAPVPGEVLATVVLFSAGGWTLGEPWLHGLVGALELWAAFELLAGTRRARAVAVLYALAVIAVLARSWLATYHGEAFLDGGRRWFDEHSVRVGLRTLHTWALLAVPAVTLSILLRPYEPLTRVRRLGA